MLDNINMRMNVSASVYLTLEDLTLSVHQSRLVMAYLCVGLKYVNIVYVTSSNIHASV